MNEGELQNMLEDLGVESDKIQEILYYFGETENNIENLQEVSRKNDLGLAILKEDDWRNRASLAARIISQNLED